MGFGPPQVVEPQPRVALPFGLFSVLALRESGDSHVFNGIEWEAMSCSPITALDDFDDPDCTTEFDKQFADMSVIGEGRPFVTYGSAKCGTPAGRVDERAEGVAVADLLANEEKQAERIMWGRMGAAAVDLNPEGALAPDQALAVLEKWMGADYGSLGIIHADRGAVSLWSTAGALKTSGNRLLTSVGTPVSAGSGYPGTSPTGAEPAAGETWVYASPAMFGYRGPVQSASALDHKKNDFLALAERNYVVGFDPCGVAAVRMTIA